MVKSMFGGAGAEVVDNGGRAPRRKRDKGGMILSCLCNG
jgi:hypothetical protein